MIYQFSFQWSRYLVPTSPLGRSSVFGSPWICILVGKKETANVDKDKDETCLIVLKTSGLEWAHET